MPADQLEVLCAMKLAIEQGDWDAEEDAVTSALSLEPKAQADALNQLLLLPGHRQHQAVTFAIQQLGHPSSVPCIRQVLANGFQMFDYTCSETGAIAKWFSHALAKIHTPEAIALIREHAESGHPEVAAEMSYRLGRLASESG